MARILMIDNYDSFTYNLVQYLGELGAELEVRRNDAIDVAGVRAMAPDAIVISPGPCTPKEAGVSVPLLREMAGEVPILGVCLGHQCIGEAFGGKVVRAGRLMHGKTSPILHDGRTSSPACPARSTRCAIIRCWSPPTRFRRAWRSARARQRAK